MESNKEKKVVATDTLRIHYTTVGNAYVVIDEDEDCYKIHDDRGQANWIPRRYLKPVE